MDSVKGVQAVQPEVARHRRKRQDLCRFLGSAILVRVGETGSINKPKRIGIVQQSVENLARIKERHLLKITVGLLKVGNALRELAVIIRQ